MFLPAWRAWHDAHREDEVHIVAKARVAALWRLAADIDGLVVLNDGIAGMRRATSALRALRPFSAISAPSSLRSALLLRLGGASSIRGTIGQCRTPLIGERVSLRGLEGAHQSIEYARIMGVEGSPLPPPSAAIDPPRPPPPPPPAGRDLLALLPRAARRGSQRRPP
jgi:hypothetical protein